MKPSSSLATTAAILLVACVDLVAGAGRRRPAAPATATRPNIVVVMVDDLGLTGMQILLEHDLMPNLERHVVARGTRFSESFVTNAICCPSRATYLTGQYSHNHETFSNTMLNGAVLAFDDEETLATWLSDAGYRTVHVGKYLNGYGILHSLASTPALQEWTRRRIEARYPEAAERAEPRYVPPGWKDWYGLVDLSTYCTFDFSLNENGAVRTYLRDGRVLEGGRVVREATGGSFENYQTDVLADKAVAVLEDHWSRGDSRPFFLSVMPLAPHVEGCASNGPESARAGGMSYKEQFKEIIRPAPRHRSWLDGLTAIARAALPKRGSFNEAEMEDKPRLLSERLEILLDSEKEDLFNQFGHRLASMMAVDDLVGRLMEALESRGELERTMVVFTSDNGWFSGEHRLSSKGLGYEEAIRVPLYIRAPGQLQGTDETRIALNNDLAPTFLDLADGVATRPVDGRSLLPLLDPSSSPVWRERFLVEHFSGFRPGGPLRQMDPLNVFGVRTGASGELPNRAYFEYFGGTQFRDGYLRGPLASSVTEGFVWQQIPEARELYSLNDDPYQMDNRLFRWVSRRDALDVLGERRALRKRMLALLSCSGVECRALENP